VPVLFYFISLAVLFILFYYLDKIFKFTANVEDARFTQLDGLRAFLALSVVYHHSIIAYSYFITGEWVSPQNDFYAILGPISVTMFFMITGFLFGFKLFKDEFNIKYFIGSRLRRIVPLYLFSVFLLVFIVFYINDFILKEDLLSLTENILRWASFKFAHFVPINQDPRVFEIQSVYWTLKWEWKFYIALPFLFLLRKKFFQDKNILFISVLLVIFFFYKYIFVFLFLLGVLASVLYIEKVYINKIILNTLGIISIILIFSFYNTVYLKIPSILTAIFFYSIVLSNNFGYILNRKIFRYFGTISYSIYLLHNMVVFIVFYLINIYYKSITNINIIEYEIIVFIIVVMTSIISMFTYKFIEHKFYKRG